MDASTAIVGVAGEPEIRRRIGATLGDQGLRLVEHLDDPAAAAGSEPDAATIFVLVCNVDCPRQITGLRRLRREISGPAIVVVSPPTTGTGVRRALDAGADAVVFEPELELTLGSAVRAVASGQSVVPRKLRASVERPNLSHRERQVLALVRHGFTNAEIAGRLYLAESTIKSHLSSIFTKFGVRSRKEAAAVSFDFDPPRDRLPVASGNGSPGSPPQ